MSRKGKELIFIFLFLITIGITGCNQKKRVIYSELIFPVDIEVELEMIVEDPIMPSAVSDIDFYNGKLVLMYEFDNHFMHFFDVETGAELGSGLRKGNGPGEVISPPNFKLSRESGSITVFDAMTKRFLSGHIDSLFTGVVLSSVKEDFGMAKYVFPLQQGYFIFEPPGVNDPECRYFIKKHDGEVVKYEGYPHDDFRLVHYIFSNHCIGFSKDETKMVAASIFGLILEIFDLKNGIEKTHTIHFWKIYSKSTSGQFSPSVDSDKSGIGVADFYGTDKYIYATLGAPNTNKQYENIAIFDWEGNPVKILRTKHYRLYRICIDDKEQFLYVVGEKNGGVLFLAKLDLTKY